MASVPAAAPFPVSPSPLSVCIKAGRRLQTVPFAPAYALHPPQPRAHAVALWSSAAGTLPAD
jgi:hypothetical protein